MSAFICFRMNFPPFSLFSLTVTTNEVLEDFSDKYDAGTYYPVQFLTKLNVMKYTNGS